MSTSLYGMAFEVETSKQYSRATRKVGLKMTLSLCLELRGICSTWQGGKAGSDVVVWQSCGWVVCFLLVLLMLLDSFMST